MHRSSRRSFLKTSGLAAGALTVGFAGSASALDMSNTTRAAETAAQGLKLARVWASGADADILAGFDDTHRIFGDGSYEILLWPGDLGKLADTGMRFEITVDDLVARDRARDAAAGERQSYDTLALQPGETDGEYRTLDEYNADMQFLADTYSDICKLIELPYRSFEGRTVYGLIICSTLDAADGKPVFYNDGIHHAREWPAAEVPIMWAFDLCEGWAAGDPRLSQIVDKTRNIIVPVVNVDGFNFTRNVPVETGTHQVGVSLPLLGGNSANAVTGQGQYWRKNRRSIIDHETGAGLVGGVGRDSGGHTAYGVDCNRNYSYHWGGDGSDTHMTGQTYRGEVPFSEPETKNVQWVHRNWHCLTGISHHTSGDLVLWAWGDTGADAPDDNLLARLGFATAEYNGYQPTKSIDLYVTTGVASDYMYGTWGSISYTFEHAGDSFHPAYPTTVPAMYAKNREALMLMAELICMEPEDRDHMLEAVNANEAVLNRLTGSFAETIEGRNYDYSDLSKKPALDMRGRHACKISGRFVDSAGNGVKGNVRITKDFENFLWFFGDGDNPIEQSQWPEFTEEGLEIETDDDGRFSWAINPSSRPAFAEDSFSSNDQRPEAWTVSFLVPNPDRNSTGQRLVEADELVIFRGQTKEYEIVVD